MIQNDEPRLEHPPCSIEVHLTAVIAEESWRRPTDERVSAYGLLHCLELSKTAHRPPPMPHPRIAPSKTALHGLVRALKKCHENHLNASSQKRHYERRWDQFVRISV